MLKRMIGGALCLSIVGCDDPKSTKDSDQRQKEQQEAILSEGTSQVGMPNIKNFRERKLLKDIFEKRDQEGFITYTYVFSEQTGKFTFLGRTIGYGVPYCTQFINPQKVAAAYTGAQAAAYAILPQADPNTLFTPASADGTWIQLMDPSTNEVKVCYIEPRVAVFPFKLPDAIVMH